MTEQLSETKELNMLKERVVELEEDYKFLSERLRALKRMEEAQKWQEKADDARRYGYWCKKEW